MKEEVSSIHISAVCHLLAGQIKGQRALHGPALSRRASETPLLSPSDEGCVYSMLLSLDTALLVPSLRARLPDNLFYCLKLSARCLHCDMVKVTINPKSYSNLQRLSKTQTYTTSCRAEDCQRPRWQKAGIYCDMHYLMIPYLTSFTWGRRSGPVDMSKNLITNLDGPKVLHMACRNLKWQDLDLVKIISTVMSTNSQSPRMFAVDTEFYQPKSGGAVKVTEIAFVDVKTDQLVVHAAFDDEQRAIDALAKLKRYTSKKTGSTVEHVQQVRTAGGLVKQLEKCHLGTDDILVEYSLYSQNFLGIRNIRQMLEVTGYKSGDLLPSQAYAVLRPIRKFLEKIMKLESWS